MSGLCRVVLLLVLALGASPGRAQPAPLTFWTTHALAKIRPHDAPPREPATSVTLAAARNEFEPFQIVLRSSSQPVEDVDVDVTNLAGPEGAVISRDNITVYLERYIRLKKASSLEGAAGEWPDALVPRVDRYAGEKRNAFPFVLNPGRNQPIWVEVYVPLRVPPGDYRGEARILAGGTQQAAIPVELRVWNFDLPSTSTLRTSFGFNGTAALKQHRGRYSNDEDLRALTALYARAALLHRISIHGGTMVPPRESGRGKIDWTAYDKEVAPFLDGAVLSDKDPLPAARATSVELRIPPDLPDREKMAYYREWIGHFREKGWLDRLFYYLWDEPATSLYPKVAEKGRVARRGDREVRNLVTASLHRQLQSVTDIWVPLINCLESKPGFPEYCEHAVRPEAYGAELRQGKNLWWYQSCASHGCNITGGEYFRGWPSYMIDVPPVANRVLQTLAWKYKIEGELYFSMDEAFARNADPWDDVLLFGGNGDGTLFYPGTPARIGGATDIPIESIRLKLIREGLEDYEYLAKLTRLGWSAFAEKTVAAVATNLYRWDRRPEVFYSMRRALGEKLDQVSGQPEPLEKTRVLAAPLSGAPR